VAGCCEYSNELSGSIIGEEFRDQLSDCQLLSQSVSRWPTSSLIGSFLYFQPNFTTDSSHHEDSRSAATLFTTLLRQQTICQHTVLYYCTTVLFYYCTIVLFFLQHAWRLRVASRRFVCSGADPKRSVPPCFVNCELKIDKKKRRRVVVVVVVVVVLMVVVLVLVLVVLVVVVCRKSF